MADFATCGSGTGAEKQQNNGKQGSHYGKHLFVFFVFIVYPGAHNRPNTQAVTHPGKQMLRCCMMFDKCMFRPGQIFDHTGSLPSAFYCNKGGYSAEDKNKISDLFNNI